MEAKINEMLDVGIIRRIHPRDVQFMAQTVLTQKTHEGEGLTLDELKYWVNSQCVEHGLPSEFKMPPQPEPHRAVAEMSQKEPKKWRMCQDFGGINKVTKIVPVPQGDIQVKQLCLSGHHVFDFSAGFYGVEIHPDSQPYITFYVEGQGYFVYK